MITSDSIKINISNSDKDTDMCTMERIMHDKCKILPKQFQNGETYLMKQILYERDSHVKSLVVMSWSDSYCLSN